MNRISDIPVYKLYGEHEQWLTADMVHCETIASRSRLHNWQIKPHQHHGLFQILFLRSGTAALRLDDQESVMCAGQVLMVPQMCIHGFRFDHDAEGHVITLAYPLLGRMGPLGEGLLVLAGPRLHTLADDEEGAHIRMAFSAFDYEYRGNAPHREQLMDSLLSALLVWLSRHAEHPRRGRRLAGSRSELHFNNFCLLIEEHYFRRQTVAWYASRIGITAAHLNVLCRDAVDQSALELIHERILLEARRNLVYTTMTVSLVSDALGFADPAYFTRFFKIKTGMSPKEFRKRASGVLETEGSR